jgi:hypothetical protein
MNESAVFRKNVEERQEEKIIRYFLLVFDHFSPEAE